MQQQFHPRASEFNTCTINVSSFLRGIQPQLEEHAATRGAELAVERAPADLQAIADQGALHQILLNLVDTAARATVSGGSIRMWCESNTEVVALRLRGAGSGAAFTHDEAVISATREVARSMGGDVKVSAGTYTVELQRNA